MIKIKETNLEPPKACNSVARNHPNDVNAFSSLRDVRNNVYRDREKSGFILPKKPLEASSTLRDCEVDTNHHGQKIT